MLNRFLYFAVVLLVATSGTADTIHLKSGKRVQCDSAWEEKAEVKCKIGYGTITISNATVASIEQIQGPKMPLPPPPPAVEEPKKLPAKVTDGSKKQEEPREVENPDLPRSATRTAMTREQMESTLAGYEHDNDGHFQILYDGGSVNPTLLREISRALDDSYDTISSELETMATRQLVVILYPKKDFRAITGAPDWSGGFNDGNLHLPVGGLTFINDDVRSVIVHELTHSFINWKGGRYAPTWLEEGLAQYMEGKRADATVNSTLAGLMDRKALPSIAKLRYTFMNANTRDAVIMYAESLAFVGYLIERYQFYAINDFLSNLGRGLAIGPAFSQAFGAELEEAERDWRQTLISE